jgi:hypothetical protein
MTSVANGAAACGMCACLKKLGTNRSQTVSGRSRNVIAIEVIFETYDNAL